MGWEHYHCGFNWHSAQMRRFLLLEEIDKANWIWESVGGIQTHTHGPSIMFVNKLVHLQDNIQSKWTWVLITKSKFTNVVNVSQYYCWQGLSLMLKCEIYILTILQFSTSGGCKLCLFKPVIKIISNLLLV